MCVCTNTYLFLHTISHWIIEAYDKLALLKLHAKHILLYFFAVNVRPRFHSVFVLLSSTLFSSTICCCCSYLFNTSPCPPPKFPFFNIFQIVSFSLPCNVHLSITKASNHASELVIGILALICISVAIVACACCHRNKSGFKVSSNWLQSILIVIVSNWLFIFERKQQKMQIFFMIYPIRCEPASPPPVEYM